jgi:hypothetical protein
VNQDQQEPSGSGEEGPPWEKAFGGLGTIDEDEMALIPLAFVGRALACAGF